MAKKKAATKTPAKPKKIPLGAGLTAPATAVREWPKLEVFSKGPAAQSRKMVENTYGKAFASKASERLCQALWTVQSYGLETVASSSPRPTIIECAPTEAPAAEVRNRARTLAGRAEGIAPALLLLARRHIMRDRFAKYVAPFITHLEGQSRHNFPAGLEAMASPTVPSSVVEVCWLNGTMRTYVDPRSLSELAQEPSVRMLDLPRPLLADIDATGTRVGAVQFRQKFSITGEHITVAVIDTEVDVNHPALAGRVMQKNNYTKERFGNPAPHGTAVAGIIASIDKKITGMGPGVTIANYKVLATDTSLNSDDFGGSLAIQQALEDGAQIANCSWGAGPAGDGTGREAVACNTAWGLGLVLVKSAGNKGPGSGTLTTPADADGIIVVGATDRAGTVVQDYSSRGPAATLSRPHLVAPGGTEFDGIHSCLLGGGLGSAGAGTSFAAPHVSGLAALLLAKNPGLQPDDIRKQLLNLCTKLADGDANTQGRGFVSLESL